jgi:glutamate/tyrosine decarboxylase-like PLP-dependent enzyme
VAEEVEMAASTSDLERRRAPLEMEPDEFRKLGHRLVDEIAAFLESLPRRPVSRDEAPRELRALLPDRLPERGREASRLLEETVTLLAGHSLFNGHPRFMGYVTSSAAPIGALADLLAAAVNPNCGGWQLSPLATEIEKQTVRWIAELLGLPAASGGLLVSGGNMANFVAFLAARRAKGGEALRREGLGADRLLAYASTETHTWLQKAADLFGHGTGAIRWIPVGADARADLSGLRGQIEADRSAGHRPFLLVGNAGTVSTGAVDPLPEMAAIAREHGLWFHVDGAYGAFAVLADDAPPELRAIAQADSVAVDPHKWLYAPLEAGCTLVRNPETLVDAFSYTPPYYHFGGEEEDPKTNFYEIGLQNSRGFRALKVWLALRQVGREGYRRMITDDIRLARELHRRVGETTGLEPLTLDLSISTFRFVPRDLEPGTADAEGYLNQLNESLLERLKTCGELFVSNAVVQGRFALRACIVNFRTSLEDVAAIPGIVVRHGQAVDRELRPDGRIPPPRPAQGLSGPGRARRRA